MSGLTGKGKVPARRGVHEVDEMILDAMRRCNGSISAYDLIEILARNGERVAPQQVYRALSHLQEKGSVRRIESLKTFCLQESDSGAVLYCDDCGKHQLLPVEDQADRLSEIAKSTGYKIAHAVVELSGHCGKCPETGGAGSAVS